MATRSSPSLKSRRLTISRSGYAHRRYHQPPPPAVPYLRLRGYWLAAAGFSAGQQVRVLVANGSITIVPEEPNA